MDFFKENYPYLILLIIGIVMVIKAAMSLKAEVYRPKDIYPTTRKYLHFYITLITIIGSILIFSSALIYFLRFNCYWYYW